MTRHPAARASAARDNLDFADVYRPGTVERVRQLIPPDSLHVIDTRPGFSWLDFEHDHWLMDATLEILGERDAVECWRQSIAHLVRRPLLRNFVEGSLRLFGSNPGNVLKMLPKAWTLAYRDFCAPVFRRVDDCSAEIRFEDVAPGAFDSPGYLHCWHAICLGALDLTGTKEGEVDYRIDPAGRLAIATFHWP